MDRSIAEQQLREHVKLNATLITIEQEMRHRIEQAYWGDLDLAE